MPIGSGHQPRILVLGVGNPILSDDGVGFRVASEIGKEIKYVDVKTSSLADLYITDQILDYDVVMIVDAIRAGGKIGEIKRLPIDNLPRFKSISLHGSGLREAIEAGRILLGERMPKKIILYAVEVEDVSTFSEKLSPKVEAAIPHTVNLMKREVENILSNHRPSYKPDNILNDRVLFFKILEDLFK